MEEPASGLSDTPAIDVVEKEEPLAVQEELKEVKDDLIRQFIKGDPGPIRADRKTSLKGDVSVSSIKEHDGFITDTLAKIYVKQGLVAKAIYAYEKLSLKYPEKSAYFAAQIEKVKNINHS
jgi:outer membrane translocation and assembly module TamA